MGAGGSLLVVAAFVLLCAKSMKLNSAPNATFWVAVIVEVVGMVVYVMHLFPQSLPIMDMAGFLLFVAAFGLLCRSFLVNPKYG